MWLWTAQSEASAGQVRTTAAAPRRELQAANLLSTADDPLSVTELMTILPDDLVNCDANDMLMRNMKWAMGQDSTESGWLTQFLGETPPTLTTSEQTLVRKSMPWYQGKFATSYLTQSFNSYKGPNAPHQLDTDQAEKLVAYLKTGLASEKDFNVQHQGIYVQAYVGAKPRLQDYLDDSTPDYVGWAQGTVIFTRTDISAKVTVPAGTVVETRSGIAFTTQADCVVAAGATHEAIPWL